MCSRRQRRPPTRIKPSRPQRPKPRPRTSSRTSSRTQHPCAAPTPSGFARALGVAQDPASPRREHTRAVPQPVLLARGPRRGREDGVAAVHAAPAAHATRRARRPPGACKRRRSAWTMTCDANKTAAARRSRRPSTPRGRGEAAEAVRARRRGSHRQRAGASRGARHADQTSRDEAAARRLATIVGLPPQRRRRARRAGRDSEDARRREAAATRWVEHADTAKKTAWVNKTLMAEPARRVDDEPWRIGPPSRSARRGAAPIDGAAEADGLSGARRPPSPPSASASHFVAVQSGPARRTLSARSSRVSAQRARARARAPHLLPSLQHSSITLTTLLQHLLRRDSTRANNKTAGSATSNYVDSRRGNPGSLPGRRGDGTMAPGYAVVFCLNYMMGSGYLTLRPDRRRRFSLGSLHLSRARSARRPRPSACWTARGARGLDRSREALPRAAGRFVECPSTRRRRP